MMRAVVLLAFLSAAIAHADPDPKRKVAVLEFRSGSTGLQGIAARVTAALAKQTSLQVLGPDQTRALYGGALDKELVKCGGKPECISEIGQRVGAAEVILLGISELGEVILTMQRIDVRGRSITGRLADSLAAGTQPTEPQFDAYLTRLLPPGDFLRFGVIDVHVNQVGAAVTIGAERRGLTPIQPMRLRAPASYDVRVEKQGFVPYTTQIQLPPDGALRVKVQLQRPSTTRWYTKWYSLAAMGLIVAGATGGTIYLATSAADSVPGHGTLVAPGK